MLLEALWSSLKLAQDQEPDKWWLKNKSMIVAHTQGPDLKNGWPAGKALAPWPTEM